MKKAAGKKAGVMSKATLLVMAVILWILFFLMCLSAGAQDRLLIAPTRIMFDAPNLTTREITISNISSDTLRYSVLFVEMHMQDNGKLEASLGPIEGHMPASQCVAFTPDRLELAPGQTRTITLTLNAEEVKDGESRSHLMLRPEVLQNGPAADAIKARQPTLTLPVIVRRGALNSELSVSNMKIIPQNDTPVLNLTLSRSGNMSVYGNVVVSYADSSGNLAAVGGVNGVAIYAPNTQRQFRIPLDKLSGEGYDISKLNIEFIQGEKNLLPVVNRAGLAIKK